MTSGSRGWASYYSDAGDVFVRITNLRRSSIYLDMTNTRYVTLPESSKEGLRTRLQKGDILVSITADLGIIGYIPDQPKIRHYINQHVALVRANPGRVYSQFLAYQLASAKQQNVINRLNDAGAKAGLSLPTIRSIPVSLPPLPEQKKIAEILSTWDRAIETTEKLLANAEAQKKALMQQLLTGKRRLKGFEGEWREVRLGDIADVRIGGTPARNQTIYWQGGQHTWLSIGDLGQKYISSSKERITDVALTKSNVKLLPANTIVMSFKLTIGKLGITRVPLYTNEAICGLIPRNQSDFEPEFLYQALHVTDLLGDVDQAVKGKTLNKAKLNEIKLRLPSLEEQRFLAECFLVADQEMQSIESQLNIIRTEKCALMQQLLTGKRRVRP
ncbi:restriction endonuclease subunit S [Stappia sp.]|uniref:restriction endonuclease subunit S n=1 Tax=Stappia sp. TaxID=1870903 RepID=UPI003C7B0654